MHADSPEVSRRAILALLGVGAVGSSALGVALSDGGRPVANGPDAARDSHNAPATPSSALHPLREGSPFARWTVHQVGPLEAGAVAVTVRGENGDLFHLEVLAKDDTPGAPRAPGESKFFAVYLRNGGDGELGTVEGHGLAAMTLATVIARNETAETAAGFLSLEQRMKRFPEVIGRPGTVTL